MLKKLMLLILVLQSIAFGNFSQSSAFVVEDRNLYCYIEDTKSIEEYKECEILSANFAINYCSYNIETVEHLKQKYQSIDVLQKEKKEKLDELAKDVALIFFYILVGIAIFLIIAVVVLYFLTKIKK